MAMEVGVEYVSHESILGLVRIAVCFASDTISATSIHLHRQVLLRLPSEGIRLHSGKHIFGDLVSGVVVSLVAIAFYISSGALLFQGPLAPHLATGIGAALAGGAVLALVSAWRGSIGLSSVGPEPATIPVLAGMTAAIASQASGPAAFPTVCVALGVVALLIGGSWALLGRFGAGDAIRYIPYPVIGGFLAAIGWLMFSGGMGVVLGRPVTLALAADLLTHGPGAQLVAGTAVAVTLWWSAQRIKHVLLLPGLIVLFTVLIHAWLRAQGLDLQTATAQGWLVQEFGQALPAWPLDATLWAAVDWSLLLRQSGAMLSAVIVSVIALLLSDSSLEVAFDTRADFNQDLKALGMGNVFLGLMGGLVGGISISRSLLNREAGAVSRFSGVVKGVLCVLAMLAGGPVIALIPKAVLGGILMYIGMGMLNAWLVDGRRRLARNDYLVVLCMMLLTMAVGYLPAVVLGVVVCCFDFAVASSRLGPLRRSFTRNEWPGKVERSAAQNDALDARGGTLRIVELQGALFFGSMRTLAAQLELLMYDVHRGGSLLIDMQRVHGMDSSAAQAMARILKAAAKHGVALAFCSVSAPVRRVLAANGCLPAGGPPLWDDLDHAVRDWEDRTLAALPVQADPLAQWLQAELGSAGAALQLMGWLQKLTLQPGDVLFRQGDEADSVYLVQRGSLVASLQVGQERFKLRSIQSGGTVGEMGVYRARQRSATVQAEEPTEVLCMTRSTLQEIEARAPELAILLHRLFVRLLASRLEHANAQAKALSA